MGAKQTIARRVLLFVECSQHIDEMRDRVTRCMKGIKQRPLHKATGGQEYFSKLFTEPQALARLAQRPAETNSSMNDIRSLSTEISEI